jgi:hypothetical protein
MAIIHITRSEPRSTRRRKLRFDPVQHQEAGWHLACIHDYLVAISSAVRNSYPRDTEVFRLADRLSEQVDRLRIELENAAFIEHPACVSVNWYFPHPEDRRAPWLPDEAA